MKMHTHTKYKRRKSCAHFGLKARHKPGTRTTSGESVGKREGLDRQGGRHFAALYLLVNVHLKLIARKPNARSSLNAHARLL
jgi:hypothetical protein